MQSMNDPANQPFLNYPEINSATSPNTGDWAKEFGPTSKPEYENRKGKKLLSALAKIGAGIAVTGTIATALISAYQQAPSVAKGSYSLEGGSLLVSLEVVYHIDGDVTATLNEGNDSETQIYRLKTSEATKSGQGYLSKNLVFSFSEVVTPSRFTLTCIRFFSVATISSVAIS
jgi:hypothetical protein